MKLQLESTYFWHRSSELQVLECWRRSIRTSVFRVLGTWSSDQQVFNDDDAHQSFQSSWSSELDQIQSSFLLSSSELQVLGDWRRSTELLVFRILWHLVLQN